MKDIWLILLIEVIMMKLKGGLDWIEDLNIKVIDKYLFNFCMIFEVIFLILDIIMVGIFLECYVF